MIVFSLNYFHTPLIIFRFLNYVLTILLLYTVHFVCFVWFFFFVKYSTFYSATHRLCFITVSLLYTCKKRVFKVKDTRLLTFIWFSRLKSTKCWVVTQFAAEFQVIILLEAFYISMHCATVFQNSKLLASIKHKTAKEIDNITNIWLRTHKILIWKCNH